MTIEVNNLIKEISSDINSLCVTEIKPHFVKLKNISTVFDISEIINLTIDSENESGCYYHTIVFITKNDRFTLIYNLDNVKNSINKEDFILIKNQFDALANVVLKKMRDEDFEELSKLIKNYKKV
jgi:hypothetical protein